MTEAPLLSIVLIVRHPAETPEAVLAALAGEDGIAAVEVLLVDGRPGAAAHPGCETLLRPGLNMPRLKAEGAVAARGRYVAFLEPKGVPLPGWLAAAFRALERHPGAALGGAVVADPSGGAADRAAYLFEYGAFPPEVLALGETRDLPGNNMILPHAALLEHCGDILAAEGLNKPFVQDRLAENGLPPVLVPDLAIAMRTRHRVGALLASRFRYARCFGGTRAGLAAPRRRWLYRLGAPAVPFLLMRRHLGTGLAASPRPGAGALAVLVGLCLAWAAGEALGSWAGPGRSCEMLY